MAEIPARIFSKNQIGLLSVVPQKGILTEIWPQWAWVPGERMTPDTVLGSKKSRFYTCNLGKGERNGAHSERWVV
jgi:hypothetical protein